MKIIFLNTWGAKMKDALAEFIKEQSADTDIFCFEEAYPPLLNLARILLPDYTEITKNKYVQGDEFLQANYIKNDLSVTLSESVMEAEENIGIGLSAQVRFGERELYICNFHGMSKPGHKLDDVGRLRQSKFLIEFLKKIKGPKIIGGDFNTLPDTKSMRMFEENGYRDLIKEYNIATTRNELAWALYPDNKQYYSDYVFVSPDVTVKSFSVPTNEISDHLPLILETE